MSKLVLNGDTSGSVTLDAPAVSGTTTLTLPTTTGTLVVTSGAQTIEFADGSASAPSITNSGDTNTGMFFPAADTIAFAEGGVEQIRLTNTGLLQFNSGYGSVATAYGCRAWVNFNGTGTVAIRGSGNVTSITDNGTGDYTVNFTTAMPDANYTTSIEAIRNSVADTNFDAAFDKDDTYSSSAVRFRTVVASEGNRPAEDAFQAFAVIFR